MIQLSLHVQFHLQLSAARTCGAGNLRSSPGMRWKQPLTFVVTEDLLEVAAPAQTEAVLVGTAAEDWRAERLCRHT